MVILPHRRKAFRSSGVPSGGDSDPYFSNVVLLLHCDGTNGSTTFTDNSSSAKTVNAIGNANTATSTKKYGAASCALDGTGDYLITNATSADFNFGTSTDFTVEAWVYMNGASPNDSNFFTTSSRTYYFGLYDGSILIGNGSQNLFIVGQGYSAYRDKWTHIAHTRSGTTHRFFLDGVKKGEATSSQSYGGTEYMNIGRDPGFGSLLNGWMDDIRITKGVARYTADFTAPTIPFPDS